MSIEYRYEELFRCPKYRNLSEHTKLRITKQHWQRLHFGCLVEIQAIAPCLAFVTRIVLRGMPVINIGTFSLPHFFPPLPLSLSLFIPFSPFLFLLDYPADAKYNCCPYVRRRPPRGKLGHPLRTHSHRIKVPKDIS